MSMRSLRPNEEDARRMIIEGGLDPEKTFKTFQPVDGKRRAATSARSWLVGEVGVRKKAGILFYGPPGTGKTHLANAIGIELVGQYGIFVRVVPTTRIPRENTEKVLEIADDDDVAILLDDIGTEKTTERALECLYLIVDGRLRKMGVTVGTTNYGPAELRARLGEYGDRVVGRLRELCVWVPVGGEDWREKL